MTFAFMPLMLAGLAAAALSGKIAPDWVSRAAPWLALAGIAFAGCSAVARVQKRHAQDRASDVSKAQDAEKDRSLRGLDRAAWLLGHEFFYQEDYRASEFRATGVYRYTLVGGEYRWDASRGRLIVTRPLFLPDTANGRAIMPVAVKALRSEALRPGPRADLGGGVLDCKELLDCRITWEIDVDRLHAGDGALRKVVDDWVAKVEDQARCEATGN